ncbi:hypothetical protein NDU88_000492 [Pleurodeles waltl]|uniref:Uncharacterized protein n=1 Tax=Pleurodeles waltl TaxID=8319 RepID=A0AAV7Q106_PLEWA|nr:hypothetical protein NDU88_000492 [Pleurodeles waltl]
MQGAEGLLSQRGRSDMSLSSLLARSCLEAQAGRGHLEGALKGCGRAGCPLERWRSQQRLHRSPAPVVGLFLPLHMGGLALAHRCAPEGAGDPPQCGRARCPLGLWRNGHLISAEAPSECCSRSVLDPAPPLGWPRSCAPQGAGEPPPGRAR